MNGLGLCFDDLLPAQANVVPVLLAIEGNMVAVQQAVGLVPQVDNRNGAVVVFPDLRDNGVQFGGTEFLAVAYLQFIQAFACGDEIRVVARYGAPSPELVPAGPETAW